jgi:hypothetical protein
MMPHFDRREFLGSSLGAGAALAFRGRAHAVDALPPHQPHDTLHLTWQRNPATTMTIQWVNWPTSDAASTVSFRPLTSDVWQTAKALARPFPDTERHVFRCELTGLESGAEYAFRIGGEPEEYRFRTMPATATNEFCFVSGGDSGVDEHAVESNKLAAAQDPHFVLIGGDIAYDNGRSPETFLQFLRNYRSTMVDSKNRLIPLVTTIGNHEVNGGFGGKRENATSYLPVFEGLYPERTFATLDFGDYLSLVLLDTGHIAPVEGEQTDWLDGVLRDRQDRQHVFAVNHVPCYPSHRNPWPEEGEKGVGEDQRKLWSPLYEKYRVDAVLEHHDHTFKRTHPLTGGHVDKNGVLYLGDGSWGKLRKPHSPDEYPYLVKSSETYHISVHRLEGDHRFHIALENDGGVADIITTTSKRPSRRG